MKTDTLGLPYDDDRHPNVIGDEEGRDAQYCTSCGTTWEHRNGTIQQVWPR